MNEEFKFGRDYSPRLSKHIPKKYVISFDLATNEKDISMFLRYKTSYGINIIPHNVIFCHDTDVT